MKIYYKILIGTLVAFSIVDLNAQQIESKSKESKILISESSIASLSKTLKKYKKDKVKPSAELMGDSFISPNNEEEPSVEVKLLKQQIAQLEDQLKLVLPSLSEKSRSVTYIAPDTYAEKISALQNDVFELKLLMNRIINDANTPNIVIVPGQKDLSERVKMDSIQKGIVPGKIQQRIDSLYILALKSSSNNNSLSYINEISFLKEQLQKLRSELNSNKEVDTTKKELILTISLKDYIKQIFFENNKCDIDSTFFTVINELVEIVLADDRIDLLIKGFASNKGTPLYNENLSLLRTEEVKKAFIRQGVLPSRIHTQYHGIDYTQTNDALGRRVDINLINKG